MQKKIIRHHLQLKLQLQKPMIQRSEQNVVTSVGTLVLTFNRILSPPDCVDMFIVSIWPPNRPKMYLFWTINIDLMWNFRWNPMSCIAPAHLNPAPQRLS